MFTSLIIDIFRENIPSSERKEGRGEGVCVSVKFELPSSLFHPLNPTPSRKAWPSPRKSAFVLFTFNFLNQVPAFMCRRGSPRFLFSKLKFCLPTRFRIHRDINTRKRKNENRHSRKQGFGRKRGNVKVNALTGKSRQRYVDRIVMLQRPHIREAKGSTYIPRE